MKAQEGTLFITVAELKALLAFSSTDKARPHLNAINIERSTPCRGSSRMTLSATDGHCLLCVECDGDLGSGPDALIARDLWDAPIKLADRKVPLRVSLSEHSLLVSPRIGYADLALPFVNAVFPPWRQVIPALRDVSDGAPSGFNCAYLSRLELVWKAAGGRQPMRIQLGAESLDPLRFDLNASSGEHWYGAIMPARL